MKIPVTINIKTERKSHDPMHLQNPHTEVRTATVNGYLSKHRGEIRCVFTEEDGDTVTTVSSIEPCCVSVNKIGEYNSLMVFDSRKSYSCVYFNGNMPMQLRVNTKKLNNGLTPNGGKIDIDYTVEIVGNVAEQAKMTFSVLPTTGVVC